MMKRKSRLPNNSFLSYIPSSLLAVFWSPLLIMHSVLRSSFVVQACDRITVQVVCLLSCAWDMKLLNYSLALFPVEVIQQKPTSRNHPSLFHPRLIIRGWRSRAVGFAWSLSYQWWPFTVRYVGAEGVAKRTRMAATCLRIVEKFKCFTCSMLWYFSMSETLSASSYGQNYEETFLSSWWRVALFEATPPSDGIMTSKSV